MRGTHTRKRSRPSTGGPRKRARFTRRRRRGGRKVSSYSGQTSGGAGLRFKSKRIGGRRIRSMLWRDTMFKQHYRSSFASINTLATPANATQYNCGSTVALRMGVQFYLVAGGAISPDAAQPTLPVFTGAFIIRGGMIGCRVSNNLDTSIANAGSILGTIFLIRTSKNYNGSLLPATPYIGWDPSLVQDFDTKIGRVLLKKNFILKDTEAAVVEYRLRTTRIDVGDYGSDFNQLVWVYLCANDDGTVSHNASFVSYYNISFCGDADT